MKMPEAILQPAPIVQPIATLSPTRYTTFLQCPLRAVWSVNGVPPLLPAAPAARLGTVIHKLLQEAGEGKFVSCDIATISERWHQLVTAEELRMASNWLERHLLPLSQSVRDYEVRRIQVCNRASGLTADVAPYHLGARPPPPGQPNIGFELYVSSAGGLIHGRIDAVLPAPEGPVIRDYKSGAIFEVGTQATLKHEYEIQVKLYAALYENTYRRWPARLELVSLSGDPQVIKFDRQACSDLLNNAITALHEVNRTIYEGASTLEQLQVKLAKPSPKNCSYCPYRPGCSAYKQSATTPPEDGWPRDAFGYVEEIQQLGNARYMTTLHTSGGRVRIRGLDANPLRHPAILKLKPGDQMTAFNLAGRSPTAYAESAYTTIYKVPERG
jgi:RecB family exonuclease